MYSEPDGQKVEMKKYVLHHIEQKLHAKRTTNNSMSYFQDSHSCIPCRKMNKNEQKLESF